MEPRELRSGGIGRNTRTDASGNWYESRGRYFVRISLGSGKRVSRCMQTVTSEAQAEQLSSTIASWIVRLRNANHSDVVWLTKVIEQGATGKAETIAELSKIVDGLCAGIEKLKPQ